MTPFTCVVARQSQDELTYAIVRASMAIPSVTALRDAITKAVTEWMQTTSDGAEAWRESSGDFNIGDLSLWLDSSGEPSSFRPQSKLTFALEKYGVKHLYIETHCRLEIQDAWTYDNHLFDAAAVEETFNEEET